MHVSFHDILLGTAARLPDAPALTDGDRTLTYGELAGSVERVARGLVASGVRPGDRVAVYLEKRLETVVSIFAVSRAGGVLVPVNPLLRARQLGHVLDDCTARVLITSADRYKGALDTLTGTASLSRVVVLDDEVAPADGASFEVLAWDELTSGAGAPPPGGTVDNDVAAILYTSGSTGRPKGVVLSHRNIVVGAQSVSTYLRLTAEDRILAVLPLSFDAGFSQLTTTFLTGGHVVLLNHLLPRDVVRACARHRITGLTAVPPLWLQVADLEWPEEATSALRFFANTGGRMPHATLDRLRTIFPVAAPYLMYGLTEAFRSTYLDPAEVDRRPDSIGKAIPNAEILVVRGDGSLCAAGEEGELVHRGPLVCLGYWNDPERTAERFRPAPGRRGELCAPDIAVYSGDVVVRDEEGFLYFVGRRDDMIKTSGYRVSPSEIEEAVHETGRVADAVALGVDDPRLGQHVVLVVSGRDGGEVDERALLHDLRERLPLYMLPKSVVVRASVPRSPNGKYDRPAIRAELLGLPAGGAR